MGIGTYAATGPRSTERRGRGKGGARAVLLALAYALGACTPPAPATGPGRERPTLAIGEAVSALLAEGSDARSDAE